MGSVRQFTQPATLRRMSPTSLHGLLARFDLDLRACGFALPASHDAIDHGLLASVLQSGNDRVPSELLAVLWSVHELARDESDAAVRHVAQQAGCDPTLMRDSAIADVVVWIALHDREAMYRLHAERANTRCRSYASFRAAHDVSVLCNGDWSGRRVIQIREALSTVLAGHGRGEIVSAEHFTHGQWINLVIGYGDALKREAAAEGRDTHAVTFRPLEHAIIRVHPVRSSIEIHAVTDWMREAARRAAGKAITGDEDAYPSGVPYYTLEPLLRLRAEAVSCGHIAGLQQVKLVMLQYLLPGPRGHTRADRADDLADLLVSDEMARIAKGKLVKATLRVRVSGSRSPYSVTVHEGNVAAYQRDDDTELVHKFLVDRGFVVGGMHGTRSRSSGHRMLDRGQICVGAARGG